MIESTGLKITLLYEYGILYDFVRNNDLINETAFTMLFGVCLGVVMGEVWTSIGEDMI